MEIPFTSEFPDARFVNQRLNEAVWPKFTGERGAGVFFVCGRGSSRTFEEIHRHAIDELPRMAKLDGVEPSAEEAARFNRHDGDGELTEEEKKRDNQIRDRFYDIHDTDVEEILVHPLLVQYLRAVTATGIDHSRAKIPVIPARFIREPESGIDPSFTYGESNKVDFYWEILNDSKEFIGFLGFGIIRMHLQDIPIMSLEIIDKARDGYCWSSESDMISTCWTRWWTYHKMTEPVTRKEPNSFDLANDMYPHSDDCAQIVQIEVGITKLIDRIKHAMDPATAAAFSASLKAKPDFLIIREFYLDKVTSRTLAVQIDKSGYWVPDLGLVSDLVYIDFDSPFIRNENYLTASLESILHLRGDSHLPMTVLRKGVERFYYSIWDRDMMRISECKPMTHKRKREMVFFMKKSRSRFRAHIPDAMTLASLPPRNPMRPFVGELILETNPKKSKESDYVPLVLWDEDEDDDFMNDLTWYE